MYHTTKSGKLVHVIYLVVIFLLLAAAGVGFYLLKTDYDARYEVAVSKQKSLYENARSEYESKLKSVIEEESQWKKELSDKQDELNEAYADVERVYAERQAEIDAETARWVALSPEEQEAEIKAVEYNEMVAKLRETNEEYKLLYVEYSKYLGADVLNIGKEDVLAYTTLYNRMLEIEKEYRESNNQ